jgi:hypothetical protein
MSSSNNLRWWVGMGLRKINFSNPRKMQIFAKIARFDNIFEKIFPVLSFSRNSTITIFAKNIKSHTKFRKNETFP